MDDLKLHRYQEDAVRFICSREAAGLFIDMGLGKTAATLHALLDLPKPVLLIGPIPVIENVWAQEAEKWPMTRGLTFSLIRGKPHQRMDALEADADIYLVNPELLPWLFKHALNDRPPPFKTLVVDESSMFKKAGTERFKSLRHKIKHFDRRVILTGTPTPNSMLELWPQIYMLDQGEALDTSFNRFQRRYFEPDWTGYKWTPKDGARDELVDLISHLVFRVDAKGILPPREKHHVKHVLSMPSKARKHYRELEAEALTIINRREVTAATAVAALMKLRQVANGFVYDEDRVAHVVHDEKIKATRRIIDETGSPVIVVYQFKDDLRALRKAFPEAETFETGTEARWNKGEIPILLLHPQSVSHGVNLQMGGHTMVVYGGSFSYEQMAQIIARIDRQGQLWPVIIHWLLMENSVDELLLGVFYGKRDGQFDLLDAIREHANARDRN